VLTVRPNTLAVATILMWCKSIRIFTHVMEKVSEYFPEDIMTVHDLL
jgi:hypothetical protein